MPFRASILGLLFATGAAHAGPLDRAMIDSGATWMVHLDFDTALKSELGRYMLDPANPERVPLVRMNARLGLDNAKDVRSITIYGGATEGPESGVAVILTSTAADESIAKVREMHPTTFESFEVDGTPCAAWRHRDRSFTMAVHTGGSKDERHVIFAPNRERLAAGVRVLNDRNRSLASITPTPPLDRTPTPGSMLYAVARGLEATDAARPESSLLQGASSVVVDIGETVSSDTRRLFADVQVEAVDDASVAEMKKAMFSLLAAGEKLAKEHQDLAGLVELAATTRVNPSGKHLHVNAGHDAARAVTLVKGLGRLRQPPHLAPRLGPKDGPPGLLPVTRDPRPTDGDRRETNRPNQPQSADPANSGSQPADQASGNQAAAGGKGGPK